MAESNNDIIKKRLQEKEKELEAEWSLSISYEKEVQKLKEQIQSLILCSTSSPSEPLDNSADIDKPNTELIKDWREQHGVTAAQISQLKVINLHAEERTGRNQGSAYGQSLQGYEHLSRTERGNTRTGWGPATRGLGKTRTD